ncbi:MAG: adenylosuccinate synthetase [Acetatifactor sp.]
MSRKVRVIIGGAYGDEGKGLATDLFSAKGSPALIVKHNGGAQAGHTVELPCEAGKDRRFVFHALSSGSFRGADTLWADTYLPDLFKLSEEVEDFRQVCGFVPSIYACEDTCITLVDDVLVNMAVETTRGSKRHGSCGMGIYEATLRNRAGFRISMKLVKSRSEEDLLNRMREIRRDYLPMRLKELGLSRKTLGEYRELLKLDSVLVNAAAEIKRNGEKVTLVGDKSEFLTHYENVIFESGQGLLLDWDWEPSLPHVTASKTGLTNPVRFLKSCGLEPDEVIYVVRSYLTRHGAGPLPCECSPRELGEILPDETNVPNPWQGSLRYSLHPSPEKMILPIVEDLRISGSATSASLLITHLNETGGKLRFASGDMTVEEFRRLPEVKSLFSHFYLSKTKYSRDITRE